MKQIGEKYYEGVSWGGSENNREEGLGNGVGNGSDEIDVAELYVRQQASAGGQQLL